MRFVRTENSWTDGPDATRLAIAAGEHGFENIDAMVERYAFSSVVPGVCPNGTVNDRVEPDGEGWCECCEAATATSILRLAGLV